MYFFIAIHLKIGSLFYHFFFSTVYSMKVFSLQERQERERDSERETREGERETKYYYQQKQFEVSTSRAKCCGNISKAIAQS
jgi:hypothetical protein